jgi:crossover junction endodeoxyribonuclease RuvC
MKEKRKIIGVDPGTNITGYAIIGCHQTKWKMIHSGILDLRKTGSHQEKLKEIYLQLQEIIEAYLPGEMAVEAPFYGKNVQSMLKLGRAQGVAMAAAMTMGLSIFEYSPKKIKSAITGNGNASKEQVAAMLEARMNQQLDQKFMDATDALGAAVCHFQQSISLGGTQNKKYKDWKSFLSANQQRTHVSSSHRKPS